MNKLESKVIVSEFRKPANVFGINILKCNTLPKWFYLILFFLLISSIANGQLRRRGIYTKNAVLPEISFLRYQGIAYLNYERILYYSEGFSFTGTTGLGAFYSSLNTGKFNGFSVPLSLNGIIGGGDNHFEASLGARYTFGSNINKDTSPIYPLINIGYRYQQSRGKGLIYRVFVGTNGIGAGVGKGF
jgi:hypothetical protein